MRDIRRGLDRVEKQLRVGEEKPCILEITDGNERVQKIQIDNLRKLLDEIAAKGMDLPDKSEVPKD